MPTRHGTETPLSPVMRGCGSVFKERIDAALSRIGEDFTIRSTTYRGVFKLLDSGTMRTYLDDVEVMGVTKPGLFLVTGSDTSIVENDTITRDGRIYTVLKTSEHRISGVVVMKTAVLA